LVGATPRLEDASAPNDAYEQTRGAPCEPPVELLRSESEARRPYRDVASLSASCYPGAPRLCENRLLARACELKADAVILRPSVPGGTPVGASKQSQISVDARAVRWAE
jgi:hypothetical protein